MAAVLGCGPGTVLSHRSAAELWGIGHSGDEIEVTVRTASPRRRARIRVYRRPTLAERDLIERDGIPVTGLVRTFVDLASVLRPWEVERSVNEADRLDLIDPPKLRIELQPYRGEPGVRPLRDLLDRRSFRLTRSELERMFLPLAKRAGLPVPMTKQWINGYEVDFYWPDLRLVVETDGLRYHRTPAEQARDRLRDQAHTAAGLVNLRFTHEQVRYHADHVRAVLEATRRRISLRP